MTSPNTPLTRIRSLYRSLLRETNRLPYSYLRAFFRFKYRDDIHSAARAIADGKKSSHAKFSRLEREARKIKAANDGDINAFERLLNLAYGRTGKLRWELLEPFLHSPSSELPPPIIPGVEKSRPPVYTKELTALLTSAISRTTGRGLSIAEIRTPRSIASRLELTDFLGPLSKRREVNARWRLFKQELHKVYPPLEVSVTHVSGELRTGTTLKGPELVQKMQELGLEGGGFQNRGLLASLQGMVGKLHQSTRPRREVRKESEEGGLKTNADAVLPTKWLRRRHRRLLGSLPLLTYIQRTASTSGRPRVPRSYDVKLFTPSLPTNYGIPRLPEIDDRNMAWLRRSQGSGAQDVGAT